MQEMQERPQAGDGQTATLFIARRGATNQPISPQRDAGAPASGRRVKRRAEKPNFQASKLPNFQIKKAPAVPGLFGLTRP